MNEPLVSVIITTLNRPGLLRRAIRSVQAQTYSNYELHVVDDGSSDDTEDQLKSILAEDDKVFYWRHDKQKGLSAARNTGISHSRGDYVAFLDDDDEWKPCCLEKRMELLMALAPSEQEKIGVVYCGVEKHWTNSRRVRKYLPQVIGNIKDHICTRGLQTISSSGIFPKKVLERIRGFDENLCSSIDHDIWMNLAAHGYHARPLMEPLVIAYHAARSRSMVTDTRSRIRGVEQYLEKWTPTYEKWFGSKGMKKYIKNYRTRVLGGLGSKKLCQGSFREAFRLIHHVGSRNGYSVSETILLLWLVCRSILEKCVPARLVDALKKIK